MIYQNFSEKEILSHFSRNSHLGLGIKRLTLKIVRCTQDYVDNGKLIYQKGREYKIWILKYSDTLFGLTKWFTSVPRIISKQNVQEDVNRNVASYHMVPLETFMYAEDDPKKASFYDFEIVNQQGNKETIRYQLFVDVNDGMQYLIEPWSLNKESVVEFSRTIYGGDRLDYTIRGRFLCDKNERHIVWLLRQYLGKKQSQDLFFDVLTQKFIDWDLYRDEASMSPISSGQAMVHIGRNSIKADKYQFIYVLR